MNNFKGIGYENATWFDDGETVNPSIKTWLSPLRHRMMVQTNNLVGRRVPTNIYLSKSDRKVAVAIEQGKQRLIAYVSVKALKELLADGD